MARAPAEECLYTRLRKRPFGQRAIGALGVIGLDDTPDEREEVGEAFVDALVWLAFPRSGAAGDKLTKGVGSFAVEREEELACVGSMRRLDLLERGQRAD